MSVAQAQREISSVEFAEWQAYAMLEPFGGERDDERAGVVAATMANLQLDPKELDPEYRDVPKRTKPFGIRDFLPLPTFAEVDPVTGAPKEEAKPPVDLKAKLFAWAAAHNARVAAETPTLRPKRPS